MGSADTQYLRADRGIGKERRAQDSPILTLAATDDVINRGQGKFLMVQVTMMHS